VNAMSLDEPLRPLRVLMLASYFPRPGNPLMGTWALAQAQALRGAGLDVTVASLTPYIPRALAFGRGARAFANCPDEYRWDGLVVHYPRWAVYPVGALKRAAERRPDRWLALGWWTARVALSKLVKEVGADVIYAHHIASNGFIACRLREQTGIRFVATEHSIKEVQLCETSPKRRALYAQVLDRSSCTTAVSDVLAGTMRRFFPAAQVRTVHNGTDPIPSECRIERPKELRGAVIVFSAGMLHERKGFGVLIPAFARVADRHPSAVLRIAGSGPAEQELRDLIARSGVAERVTLLGGLQHKDVLREMVWCDLFALPSWDEAFGVVYSEAAAAGRPILMTTDCGFMDVFQSGVHGEAVQPKDIDSTAAALERLLKDGEARARMGGAAYELWHKALTWEAHARVFASILRQVAGS
jgi:glycosyltransferase involved in cell wall biosynthesis